jgi:small-conductance mechanosensitive channel
MSFYAATRRAARERVLEWRRFAPLFRRVKSHDPHSLLLALWSNFHDTRVLWELVVLAAAIGVALYVNHLLRRRLSSADETTSFGVGGLQRLQMPLTALVVVLAGRNLLKEWGSSVELLNLAVPLLTALAIVRVVVYALRRAFAPSGGLRVSERFVAWAVWFGFAVYISGLAPQLIGFLDDVGFSVGENRVSLLLILQGLLTVGVTLLAALWLGSTIEGRLMGAASFDLSLRIMFSKVVRAALLLLAVLIVLPTIGLDLTALSVFGGALGVGLGLGLQKVASNYLSGFIILLDRSVGIGHVITVDKYTGEITKMTARYVVLRGQDGTETIIPNETMIGSPVVNHTYTDRQVRVPVTVKLGRRSDFEAALRLMEEAGRTHPRVLRDPAPKAIIKEYSYTGATLELGAWIEDPAGTAGLASDLYAEIWRRFKAADI